MKSQLKHDTAALIAGVLVGYSACVPTQLAAQIVEQPKPALETLKPLHGLWRIKLPHHRP